MNTPILTARQRRLRTYYLSDEWRDRSRRHRRRFPICAACGLGPRPGLILDVHHITYLRAFTGHEPTRDLVTLCRPHHDQVHNLARGFPPMSLRAATRRVITDHGNRLPRRSLTQVLRDHLTTRRNR